MRRLQEALSLRSERFSVLGRRMSLLPVTADCWFLTGATASGKTAVALELAQRLDAEIVSMDSMAVYRGMDIGTAKPSAAERRLVPHHLIDILDPSEELSLAGYVELAEAAVADIRSRGKEPLLVGGTPLYLKALLRGIFRGPPADWAFRREMEELARREGDGRLHARLAEVDLTAAQKLHPRDTRRIIRALEVYHKTGQPISQWQRQFDQGRPAEACRVFVLHWPRAVLHRRIDARVDAMFAAGLVEEVRRLATAGKGFSRTARQALGYREVLEHLEGRLSLEETVALVKTRTRQFAKRQLTWFRSLSECRWIELSGDPPAAEVAKAILTQTGGT